MLINIYYNLVITSLPTSGAGIRCILSLNQMYFLFCLLFRILLSEKLQVHLQNSVKLTQILIAKLIATQSDIICNSKYFPIYLFLILIYTCIKYDNKLQKFLKMSCIHHVYCFYYFKHVKVQFSGYLCTYKYFKTYQIVLIYMVLLNFILLIKFGLSVMTVCNFQ